jgi:predicted nucleic acid-binding protein
MRRILVDSGILLSYYQQQEPQHQAVVSFFDRVAAQLITSPICIAEVLWLLGDPRDPRVLVAQNHLLGAVSLDSDFDVYRRYRRQPFHRVLLS